MDWEPRVGMKVVFVGGTTHCVRKTYFFGLFKRWVPAGTALELGAVYEVSEVVWGRHRQTGREQVGIGIVNDPAPSTDGSAYPAHVFRPLESKKTDISIFTSMLVNPPKELIPASYEMPNRGFE